jgi:O-antigen/teichoic acid export membrane protein
MGSLLQSHSRALSFLRSQRLLAGGGGKALSVSVINQGVSSGTNFLLALVFIQWMDAQDFGSYGIAIASVLLFSGVGNALLLTQMVVHLPARLVADRPGYLGRYFVLVLGLAAALLALVLVAALILQRGLQEPSLARLILVSGMAAAGYLGKDYFIRICYSLRREGAALAINVAIATAAGAMLLTFGELGVKGAEQAVTVYAFGQWCGVVVGLLVCWRQLHFRRVGSMGEVVREAMAGGRWALGGVLVTWLQSQAYVYTTAMFAGASGVGYANAARIFVAPLLMAAPALNQVTVPRLASLRGLGDASVAKAGQQVTALVLVGGLAYVAILTVLYPAAIAFVLPDSYEGVGPLVLAWCVVVLAQLGRDGASTLMQVFHQFRRLTLFAAAVACLAIPVTALLASSFGAGGAVWATAMAELGLALILWQWIRRHAR